MMRELQSEDVTVFSEAILEYFATTTGRKAEVRSAYLLDDGAPGLWNDYNGVIAVSGQYVGGVRFSAPREMLTHVLLAVGEQQFTDERHRDLVGEIANTLSGRARRHFGEGLEIAPPQTFASAAAAVERSPLAAYAIPLTWHGYAADLVVQLAAAPRPAAGR